MNPALLFGFVYLLINIRDTNPESALRNVQRVNYICLIFSIVHYTWAASDDWLSSLTIPTMDCFSGIMYLTASALLCWWIWNCNALLMFTYYLLYVTLSSRSQLKTLPIIVYRRCLIIFSITLENYIDLSLQYTNNIVPRLLGQILTMMVSPS